jgi:hypothetical protein
MQTQVRCEKGGKEQAGNYTGLMDKWVRFVAWVKIKVKSRAVKHN